MSAVTGEGWQVTVRRELLDATPLMEQDPDWKYVDPAGHKHVYVGGEAKGLHVPTVRFVTTGRYWCDRCLEEHEEGEHRCLECQSPVEPGMRTPIARHHVPGLRQIEGSVNRGTPAFDSLMMSDGDSDVLSLTGNDGREAIILHGVRATVMGVDEIQFFANSCEVPA